MTTDYITIDRKVVEQALEALETVRHQNMSPQIHPAKVALRTAITEAERQEPVAAIRTWHKGTDQHCELINWLDALDDVADGEHDLYTTPQPAIPALLHEAHDYGQFADDFDQPLAKPIRKAIRDMLAAAPKPERK